jgi:hypothetical protein
VYIVHVKIDRAGPMHVIRCPKRGTRRAFPRGASSFHAPKLEVHCTTMDITPIFNQVLLQHNARPVEPYVFRVADLDEFVKEAYRIVGHVARRELVTCIANCTSEPTLPSCTTISSRYGKAIYLLHTRPAESNTRDLALPQPLPTKSPNT